MLEPDRVSGTRRRYHHPVLVHFRQFIHKQKIRMKIRPDCVKIYEGLSYHKSTYNRVELGQTASVTLPVAIEMCHAVGTSLTSFERYLKKQQKEEEHG